MSDASHAIVTRVAEQWSAKQWSATTTATTQELWFWSIATSDLRPESDRLVDAFCRLHNAALNLKKAWA